jgi:hypothetical protein
MEGTWALGGRGNPNLAAGRLILNEPKLRTSILPKAVRVEDSSTLREGSSNPGMKCLPTRCDFPV